MCMHANHDVRLHRDLDLRFGKTVTLQLHWMLLEGQSVDLFPITTSCLPSPHFSLALLPPPLAPWHATVMPGGPRHQRPRTAFPAWHRPRRSASLSVCVDGHTTIPQVDPLCLACARWLRCPAVAAICRVIDGGKATMCVSGLEHRRIL